MSRTRIHNMSISLDGFATGEPQSADAPFGHAGERLHEWMFATRFWDAGGTDGVDNAFAERRMVRPVTATVAPSLANRCAIALPRPLLLPVTSAVNPAQRPVNG